MAAPVPATTTTGSSGTASVVLAEANRKVQEWKHEADRSGAVATHAGIDLTMSPSLARGTFPGLTSFRTLHTDDVLRTLVTVPSVSVTASASVAWGAAVTFVVASAYFGGGGASSAAGDVAAPATSTTATLKVGVWRRLLSTGSTYMRRLVRAAIITGVTALYVRFLRCRFPAVLSVSRYTDVSSSEAGPCIVANRVLLMTNSHAGTHADNPHHFCGAPSVGRFDDAHYTGETLVLDLSEELRLFPDAGHAITVPLLEKALEKLPDGYRKGSKKVWRLLLVTRRLRAVERGPHDKYWDDGYAYFFRESAEFLNRVFPHLLLIATEAASVDGPGVSPIGQHAHGVFLRSGIAILENVECKPLYPLLINTRGGYGYLEGSLLTLFHPMQDFEDSRGCVVVFFPANKAM